MLQRYTKSSQVKWRWLWD